MIRIDHKTNNQLEKQFLKQLALEKHQNLPGNIKNHPNFGKNVTRKESKRNLHLS